MEELAHQYQTFPSQLLPYAIWTKVFFRIAVWTSNNVEFCFEIKFKYIQPFSKARRSIASKYENDSKKSIWLENICYSDYSNISQKNESIWKDHEDWNVFSQFLFDISQPCSQMLLSCSFGLEKFKCMKIFNRVLTDEGLQVIMNQSINFLIE